MGQLPLQRPAPPGVFAASPSEALPEGQAKAGKEHPYRAKMPPKRTLKEGRPGWRCSGEPQVVVQPATHSCTPRGFRRSEGPRAKVGEQPRGSEGCNVGNILTSPAAPTLRRLPQEMHENTASGFAALEGELRALVLNYRAPKAIVRVHGRGIARLAQDG